MLVSPTSPPSTTTAWLPVLTVYSMHTLPPAALTSPPPSLLLILKKVKLPTTFLTTPSPHLHLPSVFLQPIAASQVPSDITADSRHFTFNTVLLAVHYAVRHFCHLIEGTSFSIQTNHLPLVHTFNKKPSPCSARQQHHLSVISEFNHPRPWHSISINDMSISTMSAILALRFLFSSVDTSSNHVFDQTACHRTSPGPRQAHTLWPFPVFQAMHSPARHISTPDGDQNMEMRPFHLFTPAGVSPKGRVL